MRREPPDTITKLSKNLQLASEALLQQAIAGLLARLPEIGSVQILQGSLEYGKDIVFTIPGAFGEKILCSCVVKNHKLTGDVDSSKGARTILFQAQQSFDTPHLDGAGNERRVQRVYVVTPAPISPATIASIRGRLQERSGQVVFIGGADLFDLFKRYWPDFVAEELDALGKHLRSMSGSLYSDDPVKNVARLYNLGDIEKGPQVVYVEQSFRRDLIDFDQYTVTSGFVPSPRELAAMWKRAQVDDAKRRLSTLKRHLAIALEWEYLDGRQSPAALSDEIEEFIKGIEGAFNESLRKSYAPTQATIPTVGKDAKVELHDALSLKGTADRLSEKIDKALQPFYRQLRANRALVRKKLPDLAKFEAPGYVSVSALQDFYQVLPVFFSRDEDDLAHMTLPHTLINLTSSSILITAPAGFGKSSFCRWHALDDAEKYRTEKSHVVPAYVPLHKLSGSNLTTLADLLAGQVGVSGLIAGPEAAGNKFRIYLDGLDEIADVSQRQRIATIAKEAIQKGVIAQVVVTARDYVFGSWLRWLPRVHLRGFDDDQIHELVTKWLDTGSGESGRFLGDVKKSQALWGLMRTPLLATLIILVFRQTGRLPENEARLYEMFTDLLSEGWNLAKRVLKASKFGSQVKIGVLRRLAVGVHQSRRRLFKREDIVAAAQHCVNLDRKQMLELVEEVLQDGLVVRTPSSCEFSHLSFQEYFTAKHYYGDPSQRGIRRALKEYLAGDDWWYQTLRFYIGLSGSPEEIDRWLAVAEDKVEPVLDVDPHERARELARILHEFYPQFAGFA